MNGKHSEKSSYQNVLMKMDLSIAHSVAKLYCKPDGRRIT